MKNPPVQTTPSPEGWNNQRDGENLNAAPIPTKKAAVAAGRALAKELKTEHVIHKKDGTIREKNSYGNDPRPPKGSRG